MDRKGMEDVGDEPPPATKRSTNTTSTTTAVGDLESQKVHDQDRLLQHNEMVSRMVERKPQQHKQFESREKHKAVAPAESVLAISGRKRFQDKFGSDACFSVPDLDKVDDTKSTALPEPLHSDVASGSRERRRQEDDYENEHDSTTDTLVEDRPGAFAVNHHRSIDENPTAAAECEAAEISVPEAQVVEDILKVSVEAVDIRYLATMTKTRLGILICVVVVVTIAVTVGIVVATRNKLSSRASSETGNNNSSLLPPPTPLAPPSRTPPTPTPPASDPSLVLTVSDILTALYESTNGNSWENNSLWLSESSTCLWYGITCDTVNGEEVITSIDLSENGLHGSIATALGLLEQLTSLAIYESMLSGSIPTEVGLLKLLTALDLGGNELTGPVPTELGQLLQLRDLYLYENTCSGSIPTELGHLTQLTSLDLGGNDMTGRIPTEIGHMTQLYDIFMWENRLTGPIPTQVGFLTQLRTLDFGGNGLSGTLPTEIGQLTKLLELILCLTIVSQFEIFLLTGGSRLTGAIPQELGRLTQLTTLEIGGNDFTGSIPSELEHLTQQN